MYLSALSNVREAVIPNGRMTAAGSDAYQKVLLQTGHLKEQVAFDAVFTNQYLPDLNPHAAKDKEISMGAIEDKIKAMGYTLPEPFKFPKPNRTGCVVVGSIVFVSGHGRYNGPTPGIKTVGKLGRDLTIEEGYATARARRAIDPVEPQAGARRSRPHQAHRAAMGMVNVAPGFDRMPEVIDGASDFFYELLGPKNGQHARTAVGLAELPHGIPVEINGEFELKT